MKLIFPFIAALFVTLFLSSCVDDPYTAENDPHPPAPYSPDPMSHVPEVRTDPLGATGRY